MSTTAYVFVEKQENYFYAFWLKKVPYLELCAFKLKLLEAF